MADKKWLLIDKDFCDSPKLKEVEALEDGKSYTFLMMKLLIKTAKRPFVKDRCDIVPCDAEALAKELDVFPGAVRDAINVFYTAGLVKALTEEQLKVVVHGAVECKAPSFEDVDAFAKEKGLAVDTKRFFEYYNASGFKFKGQLIDWKEKLLEWSLTERPKKEKVRQNSAASYYGNRKQPVVDLAALQQAGEAL